MNGIPPAAPTPSHPMSRELLLTLLKAGLSTGELRYARRICTSWLAVFPGDLQVRLLHAYTYYKDPSPELRSHALAIVDELCKLDPEYLEAQQLLANLSQTLGKASHAIAKSCARALANVQPAETGKNGQGSTWSNNLFEARSALSKVKAGDYQQYEKAEHHVFQALTENADTPLPAVVHLQLMASNESMPKLALRNLAQNYHERWPDCIQFQLTYADKLMETGESNLAVDLLHQVVVKDVAGQVAKRMWGAHHQYSAMWPVSLEASNTSQNSPQNILIPTAVASSLGWSHVPAIISDMSVPKPAVRTNRPQFIANRALVAPQSYPVPTEQTTSSMLSGNINNSASHDAQNELEKMADELKRSHLAHEDGRFPTYVVFTTRKGLSTLYEPGGVQNVDAAMKKLVAAVRGHKLNQELWGAMLFYADDQACTQAYGLQPATYNDAWQLKLIISDLEAALRKQGARIGALLIVGGPEIVPFHNLPNPVEDADSEVPSDNPYATKDTNYFISDWPVGRISGGYSSDARALLTMLKEITGHYDGNATKASLYRRFIRYIRELIQTGLSKKISSFGYTAAVWRRASLSVFRPIGNPDDLLISPPVHACDGPCSDGTENAAQSVYSQASSCLLLPDTKLAYFNLHGVPDAAEWYGQSDPTLPADGPEFPVAMRPRDIRNSGSAPRMVFSEACYGVNIAGKSVDDAISLKFLASGTQAVVGSTCISYGSLSTPLSSADLLGRVFWNLLQEGFTAGEALRRAKIHLTREMNQRQGFLDAEDQKTLISFVLVGDPLAQPFEARISPKITPHLSDDTIRVPTVCERSCEGEEGSSVSLETISHLKTVVAQYLPEMNDAKVSLFHEHQTCANLCGHCGSGKKCAFSQANSKNSSAIKSSRRVVTLSKNFEANKRTHRQYARVTLDERGKIVKMVVSH